MKSFGWNFLRYFDATLLLNWLVMWLYSSYQIYHLISLCLVLDPLLSFKGGSKFWLPPTGGGTMVQGQVFLKGGGALALFLLNFFKVYHFYISKLLFPLQNCVMHLKKKNFFCHHNFMKKRCLKMNLKICYKLR